MSPTSCHCSTPRRRKFNLNPWIAEGRPTYQTNLVGIDLGEVKAFTLIILPRKEVIQPQLPLRLPCYDFVPITSPTLGDCLFIAKVSSSTSSVTGFHDVTGGVYKARERIHRNLLTCVY